MSTLRRVHFPNLDSLRFIAAMMVVVCHIEDAKRELGLPHHYNRPVTLLGWFGVDLFFVLSGFLITYLLLAEREDTGQISIRRFYARRILRIWPLYYFVIGIALFVLPWISVMRMPRTDPMLAMNFGRTVLAYLLLIPNLAPIAFPIPYGFMAWSIGVEEQFYAIWPWVIRKLRSGWVAMAGLLAGWFGVRLGTHLLYKLAYGGPYERQLSWATQNIEKFCGESLILGGLTAVLCYEKSRVLKFVFHPVTQVAAYVAIVAAIFTGFTLPWRLNLPVVAVFFAILIANLACNPRTLFYSDSKWMAYGGRISYGIYMYHLIAIGITLKIALRGPLIRSFIAQYVVSIFLTLMMAIISYELFEKRFLRLKDRFSSVETDVPLTASGDDASSEEVRRAPHRQTTSN